MVTPQRMQVVTQLFQSIWNHWAKSNSFEYTVKAPEDIDGKPLDEIRRMKFWTGVLLDGTELSFDELLTLFSLISDQTTQAKQKRVQTLVKSRVTTEFSDDEAIQILNAINIIH